MLGPGVKTDFSISIKYVGILVGLCCLLLAFLSGLHNTSTRIIIYLSLYNYKETLEPSGGCASELHMQHCSPT